MRLNIRLLSAFTRNVKQAGEASAAAQEKAAQKAMEVSKGVKNIFGKFGSPSKQKPAEAPAAIPDHLKRYKPSAMGSKYNPETLKGAIQYTYYEVPEVHVLLYFMVIPCIASGVFAFYNLFNYEFWFDKSTPLRSQDRMSKEFRSSPRYMNAWAPNPPLSADHEERIEEARTWGVEEELNRQQRVRNEQLAAIRQRNKNKSTPY